MITPQEKLQTLQQASELTQSMLDLAKQQKWEDLQAIEKKRQFLLQTVFPVADDSSEIEGFTTELQTLIDINNQLIAHCQQGKDSLQLQMRDAKFTQKAVTAYQSN
ncbi:MULTISPECIES: flagellar protein FliT [Methylophaga]|uniref:Flagellar protein FliT n=1 Tax=Methylophaga muralis TaxID=291169 RepID=A0A1E3GPT6_9GAMM|nr:MULTISPECIES: flagellar protein FliT [Methylophaga]ODN66044.1 Flagellar protein FliT [Methylophaga muralis]THF73024.1 MAG: flagellar protein FliT [Methylophaga nitratireducenticrescens]THK40972.1 flagellar protein FliT [Methylophaga sp. SB9B]